MRLLIIGDTHVPRRALSIPERVRRAVESMGEWDIVVFTGDLTTPDLLQWINGLGRDLRIVRGNMDYLDLPEYEVIDAGELRIGVVHGDQVYPRGNIAELSRLARKLGVNILVSGHTHYPFIVKDEASGVLHVNPGSLTGVWGGGGGSMRPSFATLKIGGRRVEVCIHEFEGERESVRCETHEL